jgi:hypothetical protein
MSALMTHPVNTSGEQDRSDHLFDTGSGVFLLTVLALNCSDVLKDRQSLPPTGRV